MKHRVRALVAGLSALLVAACAGEGERPRHVLLISIDALRADRLGAYGHLRPTSPFLDSLAARGRLFEQAFVNTHGTTPSHTTILSGLYQQSHGVGLAGARGGVVARQIPEHVPLVQEILRAHGFTTLGVTAGGNAGRRFGFARGFDRFDDEGGDVSRLAGRLLHHLRAARAAGPQRSIFAFLHTYQVHSPYEPPPEQRRRFGVAEGFRSPPSRYLRRYAHRAARLPPGTLDQLSRLYDAEVRTVDEALRELFATLRAEGFLDSSLVVVTADHGEELGEHGGLLHRALLYDELLRVPLIVVGAGVSGERIDQPVSSIDITPTLLDWAGIPIPAALPGRSLLGDLARRGRQVVFAQYGSERYAVRTPGWKLILSEDGSVELYDLRRDPGERRNLAGEEAEQRRRLAAALAAWRARTPGPGDVGAPVELSREDEARLRALGYLGGD